ncbi:TenA family transcriptional regulator [Wolbachia pipientis]|uniref:TenA family transcriptional regulator n=1 Tax=Wolbachia pipientis TaxID=955 RepID=A0A6H2NUV3_WOLPI|nr:TenA family transcriptional regulator [Wolbachia pipientis]
MFSGIIRSCYGSNLLKDIIEHPFNVKLANNTLNVENFKFYAQQKTLFLGDYIRTTLITASRMEDYSSITSLTEVAQRVVTVNRVLYDYYFTMYSISRGKKSLECFNFTNFLLSISYSNTYEAMTVLYSCMFIYKTVVDSMKNRFKRNNKYRDWFYFCYSDSVKSGCIILENIIDGYCSRARESERTRMLELFKITAQFELDFWSGAYNFSKFDQDFKKY